MAKIYKNLPLSTETYANVAMIAEANGFGARGLGKQVEDWVKQNLPDCGHKKQAVDIQYFGSSDGLQRKICKGWYCKECNRVYEHLVSEVAVFAEDDPYGNIVSVKKVKG